MSLWALRRHGHHLPGGTEQRAARPLRSGGNRRRFTVAAVQHVTLPMISGALFFTFIIQTIAAFQSFDEAYTAFFGNARQRRSAATPPFSTSSTCSSRPSSSSIWAMPLRWPGCCS